jgi:hypothetical protein
MDDLDRDVKNRLTQNAVLPACITRSSGLSMRGPERAGYDSW